MIEKLVGEHVTKDSCCPDLDYKTRILGFVITALIGVLGIIIILIFFFTLGTSTKAIIFTCSSLCCVLSTLFMVGPKKQWENMMKPQRMITSIVYFGSMVMTIIAFIFFTEGLSFLQYIFMAIQIAALIWYVLSYIPFAQKFCTSCMKNCAKGVKGEDACNF